ATKRKVVKKGYYEVDEDVVLKLHDGAKDERDENYQSTPTQIMDFADDIAYSVYDMQDAFTIGIIHPFDLAHCTPEMLETIHTKVDKDQEVRRRCKGQLGTIEAKDIKKVLEKLSSDMISWIPLNERGSDDYVASKMVQTHPRHRTKITSKLIDEFINALK